jgi:hypothetical protein
LVKLSKQESARLGGLKTAIYWKAKKQENIKKYLLAPKICIKESCSNVIPYEKRFENKYCGSSCSATCSNLKRTKSKIGKSCLCGCENLIFKRNQKFYSIKCHQKFQFDKFIIKWKNGQDDGVRYNGKTTSNFIKRYLREKLGNKCQRCEWSEINPITGIVPVQLEHIDGHSENNKENNLTLLCPSCHSLTPTFGNLNKGNGRTARYL